MTKWNGWPFFELYMDFFQISSAKEKEEFWNWNLSRGGKQWGVWDSTTPNTGQSG